MMKTAEHVYTMSESKAELLKHYFESEKDRISSLGEVPDPFGGDLDTYRHCRDSLLVLIKNLKEQVK
jgi:protein-tyrosine phosphatase